MQTSEQQILISEDNIITPLACILEDTSPSKSITITGIKDSSITLRKSLDNLFPEQQYDDKAIQKAKEILGKTAYEFSKEQLEEVVAEIQFLITSWLDDYERSIFGDQTLAEFLHERGGK